MIKKRLMTPGPTEIHPRVQQAMNAPIINHRKEEFKALFQKTRGQLQQICKTQEPVLILAASGSGGLEAALTSLLNPGDKLLVINAGKFGERFSEIAKTFGMIPVELTAEWGHTVPAARVAEALAGDPAIRAVCVQGSETSTATRHDVEGIAAAVKKHAGCLMIVDGITAIGCQRIDMDGWSIDALVGGSQKAFMLPPGLAFVALSAKARAALDTARKPGFYFNLKKELKSQEGGETAYTPAISLVAGLSAALEVMLEKGPDDFADNARLQAEMTRAAARALGLELFSRHPADSCTAILIPEAIGGANVVKTLQNEFGLYVAGGQNQLKGRIIRIAHLGYYDALDTIGAVAALELTLLRLGAKVEPGAGVRAAQAKYFEMKK